MLSRRSVALCTTVLVLLTAGLLAQSPEAVATLKVGGKTLSIRYSAPSLRGRKVFAAGGVVSKDPTYPVWRAGANAATLFHSDADLTIGTLPVPKGSYTLFVSLKNPETWELIINKQTGQGGLDYTPGQDLGRVKMAMARPPAPIEKLKYTLTDKGGGNAELRLEWELHVATVPIIVK